MGVPFLLSPFGGFRYDVQQMLVPLGVCSGSPLSCDWFWFEIVGVTLLFPILLFGAQLVYYRKRLFMDRFSTNQKLMNGSINRSTYYDVSEV